MEAFVEDHDNDPFVFYIDHYAEDYNDQYSPTPHTHNTTTH